MRLNHVCVVSLRPRIPMRDGGGAGRPRSVRSILGLLRLLRRRVCQLLAQPIYLSMNLSRPAACGAPRVIPAHAARLPKRAGSTGSRARRLSGPDAAARALHDTTLPLATRSAAASCRGGRGATAQPPRARTSTGSRQSPVSPPSAPVPIEPGANAVPEPIGGRPNPPRALPKDGW